MKARSILTSLICGVALGTATLPALAGDKPEPFPKAADEAPGQWPQVVSQVQPLYPAKMLAEKIEGDVQVALVVTAKGDTTQVRAFFSTRPEFEEPAIEAVKQWKFTPGMKDGRAVNTQMVVPIKFALPAHGDKR
ncbi:energy transducer TonB [Opitutus terrae]|uniref:TonB family protein n=1 Tax=Opitutus terrae (strain DSM 11246 / JCM 15787 / PB90-1) TaxID=452637 RepID=B1ZMN6_OPITP|nr:energy transducer TonB [Opitutus terrae]ACB74381.1 TonB family protein [Opitutus terrae PB90-1]